MAPHRMFNIKIEFKLIYKILYEIFLIYLCKLTNYLEINVTLRLGKHF